MKLISSVLAFIFHPLLMLTYGTFLVIASNPFAFGVSNPWDKLPLVIVSLAYTFFLPLIGVIFMVFLKLIPNFHMHNKEDRIGPLIIVVIFYTWFFINLYHNPDVPVSLHIWILGSLIAVSLSFFFNVFTKISLHMVGAGGLVGIILLLFMYFDADFLRFQSLQIHIFLLLFISILVAGLIGSSRLQLKAHKVPDIYGGALVGVVSQLIALRILV